ncbi:MAG: hypothetical protein VYA30_15245 [Myxococcota bacterium]|nr:hypothetical protein [Myxococcota bacterium]
MNSIKVALHVLSVLALFLWVPPQALSQARPALSQCGSDNRIVRIAIHASANQKGWTQTQELGWLDAQFKQANRLFEPIKICFVGRLSKPLSDRDNRIRTRAQRTRLGRMNEHQHPGDIALFIVDRLDDIDLIGQQIRGVHWRDPKNRRDRRWIILSRLAKSMVLAHELGHYFSLPHSDDPISIMNKQKRAMPPFRERRFSDAEMRQMAGFAEPLFRRGYLIRRTDVVNHDWMDFYQP